MVLGELILRYYLGFGNAVLMESHPDYEYIAQANQKRSRFNNRIIYNEYGMRNKPVNDQCIKILGFGDSVINGGTLTDHDSLATSKLSKNLSEALDTCVQVLNISAGSWGPDNAAAFLKKHGDFNAKLIFLVANSHDAHDNMAFEPIVGVYPDFPNKQYSLAWHELLNRYIIPLFYKEMPHQQKISLGIQKNGQSFNPGFSSLAAHAEKKNIPFIIYLQPEITELKNGTYNQQGQEIINFASKNNIPIIKGLNYKLREKHYRDQIHLNESGQRQLLKILFPVLLDSIKSKIPSLINEGH